MLSHWKNKMHVLRHIIMSAAILNVTVLSIHNVYGVWGMVGGGFQCHIFVYGQHILRLLICMYSYTLLFMSCQMADGHVVF